MVDIFTAGVFILGVSNKNHGISVIQKTPDFDKGHFTKEALYQGGWTQKFVWVIYWGRNAQIQKIRVF